MRTIFLIVLLLAAPAGAQGLSGEAGEETTFTLPDQADRGAVDVAYDARVMMVYERNGRTYAADEVETESGWVWRLPDYVPVASMKLRLLERVPAPQAVAVTFKAVPCKVPGKVIRRTGNALRCEP